MSAAGSTYRCSPHQMPEAPAFEAWLEAFHTSYFRRRPVNATFIGMHAYDDRLPDFSELGLADALGDAEDLLRRLHALPPEPLSASQELDHELAEGFLLIQRWESHSAHFASANPTLFTGEAIFGLISVLLRPFAPLQHRLDVATARLEAAPGFLQVGMRQVTSAPAAWIERARRECLGARLLLENGIAALLLDADVECAELRRAARGAAAAFGRFDRHLQDDVRPTEGYASGGDALNLLLRYAHMLPMDAEQLERLALDRIAEEQEALLSAPTSANLASESAPDDYLGRFDAWWHTVRDTAIQHDLVSFPDWPVRFVERPTWAAEAAPYLYFLPYRSPAPLDETPVVDYLVPPGSDESTIKLNHVVHHASLGHHVQNWFAARATSRIGRIAAVDCASRIAMLCGGTMAEGWATYATDLAEEVGLLTPAERHELHRARLRMAARAVVDIRLHQERLELGDAVTFYTQKVGMSSAAATAEAVKNSLFPGAACMYLAGWHGLRQLRRDMEARLGADFSLREFHDRVLSFGSVPVSLIARAMLETPGRPVAAHV
jgi:Bacterial protein of unknown function (DUF885)